ncbi:osmoprotectant transport system ATP-binding protein [Microlunatus sagamiharensis]|uniref:ABC-type quaternary amine transporter n=1 Tax=Microlunatus sagamiharensis TaxID=546874 RepID=A0A1H2N1C0_9ACTN|nr:ATP-binding cassette domain-containing protein [Microlunatus sagamiharensis]SDU99373.1 osmoprotectant transport system ATP-binding protein [Microlunatus sagamiharensis]
MIEFESVSKTFSGGTHAVQDLSLSIPSDQITVIVGPSGCGKTTTLRMINRMLEPSSGRIVWDGKPLKSQRKTTLRRQMGYVIQSGGLFPHRTIVENIGTVPGLLGWDRTKTRKRSMELLANVGLDRGMAERYPAQLSGGQQQRVGVARALAADPLVMLMDEPFSAVDPVVRTELHEFFLSLQRQISKTIVLITHDIDEAIKLGDQVAILRVGGRLAQVGPPQQLLDEPADAFVEGFVGRDRGYRSLSFLPADGLRLGEVAVVREAASSGHQGPTLVLDGDARPVGWVDEERAGLVHPIGGTFVREADTLRAALDSALTSPYAIAVAVEPDTGRYAGVVTADEILDQVRDRRSGSPESITVEAAEAREQQSAEAQTAVTTAYAQLDDSGDPVADQPERDEAAGEPDQVDTAGATTEVPSTEQQLAPGGATAAGLGEPGTVARDAGTDEAGETRPERQPAEEQPAEARPTEDDQPTAVREAVTDEPGGPEEQPRQSGLYRTPRSLPHEEGPRG